MKKISVEKPNLIAIVDYSFLPVWLLLIDSDLELWPWEHFIQEYLTQIGGS